MRRKELLVAAALLCLLGALVYLPHIRGGGLYSDDWQLAANSRFAHPPRFIHAIEALRRLFGTRPLLDVAKALTFGSFDLHSTLHLTLAVVLAVVISASFFAVLRILGLEPLPAILIAVLTLVLPWSDSTRLWATAGLNQLSLCFYLVGVLVALTGLSWSGAAGSITHAGALVLYAAALLVYEAVGGLILLTGLLYLVRARLIGADRPWRLTWPRWLADVVVAVSVLAWSANAATGRPAPSLHEVIADLPTFARQALSLVLHALSPAAAVLLVIALLLAIVFAIARARSAQAPTHFELRRWLVVAGLAGIGLAAGFAPLVGSGLHPLDQGLNNRGNLAVALPLCVFVYAVIAILAQLALRGGRARGAPALLSAVLITAIALGYVHQVRGDIARWNRAAVLQRDVLTAMRDSISRPRSGSVVYVVGYPALVSPGVSIFSETWDLSSAAQLTYADPSLNAYPIVSGASFVCSASRMYPLAAPAPWDALQGGYGQPQGAAYGKAILLDAASGRPRLIDSATRCRQLTRSLSLAPLVGQGPSRES